MTPVVLVLALARCFTASAAVQAAVADRVHAPSLSLSTSHTPYTARYGAFFVWHALSVTVAWALILPAAQLLQAAAAEGRFQLHRRTMLFVLFMTAQTHLLAPLFAPQRAPAQHVWLGSLLLLAVSLQAVAGALRPDAQPLTAARIVWSRFHRVLGLTCFFFALFLLHHSLYVFRPSPWMNWLVQGCIVFALLAFVVVIALKLRRRYSSQSDKTLELQRVEVESFLPG